MDPRDSLPHAQAQSLHTRLDAECGQQVTAVVGQQFAMFTVAKCCQQQTDMVACLWHSATVGVLWRSFLSLYSLGKVIPEEVSLFFGIKEFYSTA